MSDCATAFAQAYTRSSISCFASLAGPTNGARAMVIGYLLKRCATQSVEAP